MGFQVFCDGERAGNPETSIMQAKYWAGIYVERKLRELTEEKRDLRIKRHSAKDSKFVEQADGCYRAFSHGFSLLIIPV